nr:hypothetical protein [Microvirga sp. HBU65207]
MLGSISAEMPDLLSFGFGGMLMIVAGLGGSTRRVRRSHVVWRIPASEFQGSNMLDDPTLADAINAPVAQNADSSRTLPDGEPHPRREPRPPCRPEI